MLTDAEKAHVPVWCVSHLNYLPIFSHHQRSKEESPLSQNTSVKFVQNFLILLWYQEKMVGQNVK